MRFKNGFLAALLILGLWELAALWLDRPFLPTPLASFLAFARLMREGAMLPALLISTYRVVASSVLALAFAIPLGIAMGRKPWVNRLFSPLVTVLYPLPKVVFLPILVVLLGLGNAPKLLLIALIIFFQILVVMRDAVLSIPEESLLSMRSLSATPWQTLRHLIWPRCLPELLTSLRISVGTAIAVLFFAETFASFDGLGHLILNGMERRDYAAMYAGIIGMALLGIVLYELLALLERRYCHWARRL